MVRVGVVIPSLKYEIIRKGSVTVPGLIPGWVGERGGGSQLD